MTKFDGWWRGFVAGAALMLACLWVLSLVTGCNSKAIDESVKRNDRNLHGNGQ